MAGNIHMRKWVNINISIYFCIDFRHASVFVPSTFMEHEPQIPSLQDLLKVKLESTSSLIFIKASKTIGPHLSRSSV